jgi:hypothetical protein
MKTSILAAFVFATAAFAKAHALDNEGTVPPLHLAASQSRTLDDFHRVVDKHKGAIYSVYARALRDKPGLQGTITLAISIAPNGKVTRCAVASSTLNDSDFENRLVERFLSIDFGAKGTEVFSTNYPLSLFSASGTQPNKQAPQIVR